MHRTLRVRCYCKFALLSAYGSGALRTSPVSQDAESPVLLLSTKAGRQSTLGYTHGSSLPVDGARATNSMVTQDTDKVFI